jgi:hypothetical protein
VISPLLCTVYLHRLDRVWSTREHGVLVRYAHDVLVMCKSREQAEAALQRLRDLLAELGLQPKEAKTRIVHLQVGGEGVDFLDFHHRLVSSRSRDGRRVFTFLTRWPADKAMQHARDTVRTDRGRSVQPSARWNCRGVRAGQGVHREAAHFRRCGASPAWITVSIRARAAVSTPSRSRAEQPTRNAFRSAASMSGRTAPAR